jgi:hypothetical protein
MMTNSRVRPFLDCAKSIMLPRDSTDLVASTSMDTPIFEQITSALTVKTICSPLGPDIPSGSTADDLNDMLCAAVGRVVENLALI